MKRSSVATAGPCSPVRTMWTGSARSSSDGVRLEAARLLNTEGKIDAIKYVREKKGLGLAQAKAYVEALGSGRNPDEAARALPEGKSGSLALLLWVLLVAGGAFAWLWSR